MTAEHLISVWANQLILKRKPAPSTDRTVVKAISTIWKAGAPGDENEKFAEWISDAPNFTTKCVCAPCNNNWMGDIEKAARPILTEMIEGRTVTISRSDEATIAKWLALKGVIEQYARPGNQPSERWAEQLYVGKAPPIHWRARIGVSALEQEAFIGGTNLNVTGLHRLAPFAVKVTGFIFTIAIGHFFGQAIGLQSGVERFPINERYFIPVWPPPLLDGDVPVRTRLEPRTWPPERRLNQAQLLRVLKDPAEPRD